MRRLWLIASLGLLLSSVLLVQGVLVSGPRAAATVSATWSANSKPGPDSAGASPVENDAFVWADYGFGKIRRANLDGSGVTDLVAGLDRPQGLAIDAAHGKLYWATPGKIQRANLDGSGVEDLVTGLTWANGIALDVAQGKMYWTDRQENKILRASLDGGNVSDLCTTGSYAGPIAIDLTAGKLYWGETGTGWIRRANLDCSAIEPVVYAVSPGGIALDPAGKVYYTNYTGHDVRRANLDGSGDEQLVSLGLAVEPMGVALDGYGLKVYWTAQNLPYQQGRQIGRANLDGSGQEVLTTDVSQPRGIELELAGLVTPTATPTATPTETPTATPTATSTSTATPTATATVDPNLDSDGDGYPDVVEMALGTDPYSYCAIIRADLNMDGKVNLLDLGAAAAVYGQKIPPAPERLDQNGDGKINLLDLGAIAAQFGKSVSACP